MEYRNGTQTYLLFVFLLGLWIQGYGTYHLSKEQMVRMKQKRRYRGWVTVNDVAEYCLTSNITVRRWIRDGKIRAIKLPGGHYRVSIEDFRAFLDRYDMPVEEEFFACEYQ